MDMTRDTLFRRLWYAGTPRKELARRFHRSDCWTSYESKRLGLKPRHRGGRRKGLGKLEGREAEIHARRQAGDSWQAIADDMGVTAQAVLLKAKRTANMRCGTCEPE